MFSKWYLKGKNVPQWTKEQQEIGEQKAALWIGGSVLSVESIDNEDLRDLLHHLNPEVRVFFVSFQSRKGKIN